MKRGVEGPLFLRRGRGVPTSDELIYVEPRRMDVGRPPFSCVHGTGDAIHRQQPQARGIC